MDLRWQMDQLGANLRSAFPDMGWNRSYDFSGQDPLGFAEAAALMNELGDIDARELATFPIGEGIVLRVGRYGPYVEDEDGDRGKASAVSAGVGRSGRRGAAVDHSIASAAVVRRTGRAGTGGRQGAAPAVGVKGWQCHRPIV